ncbi:unnamed protein product, partial [Ectocarpus sp. 12 AP-2014]
CDRCFKPSHSLLHNIRRCTTFNPSPPLLVSLHVRQHAAFLLMTRAVIPDCVRSTRDPRRGVAFHQLTKPPSSLSLSFPRRVCSSSTAILTLSSLFFGGCAWPTFCFLDAR